MLTGFKIKSFKSFRDEYAFNIAPINLVYGENSAGKSSLIQAMLLMKQSWRLARAGNDDELLSFRGSFIDLGGYAATVTDHDYSSNELTI